MFARGCHCGGGVVGTTGLIARRDRGLGGDNNAGEGVLGTEGPAALELLLLLFSLSLSGPLTPGLFGWEGFLLVWSDFGGSGSDSMFLFFFSVDIIDDILDIFPFIYHILHGHFYEAQASSKM